MLINSSQHATSTGNISTFFHIVNILLSPHHISSTCFIQTIITRKSLGLNILTEETSQSEVEKFFSLFYSTQKNDKTELSSLMQIHKEQKQLGKLTFISWNEITLWYSTTGKCWGGIEGICTQGVYHVNTRMLLHNRRYISSHAVKRGMAIKAG